MNVKKIKLFSFIYLFIFCSFISYAQSFSSKYVIETEYFDIIYDVPSEKTAIFLSEKIDSLYLNILNELKLNDKKYFKHFPIYIEWTTQEFNAYFSRFPFKYIVFYDTAPSDSLFVFDDIVTNVLKHELVHAITTGIADIPLSLAGLSATMYSAPTSILEGISVYSESVNGQGRLNNPYSTHILRQSIIDEKFPTYRDITGARDIYPIGELPYIFGGAFTEFVIKKYGIEKYRDFLQDLNNKILNYDYVYKKVFDTKISDDWEEFRKTIVIPTIQKDLYNEEGIENFSNYENNKFKQNKLYRYEKLTSFVTKDKSAMAWITSNNGHVLYYEKNNNNNRISKVKHLFTMTGIDKINFSSDGKFLVISRTQFFAKYKKNVLIYDMEKKSFIQFPFNGYRDGIVFNKDGKNYFAAVHNVSQNCDIEIYLFDNKKIIDKNKFEFLTKLEFKYGDVPVDLIDLGKGVFSFILNSKNEFSINLYDLNLNQFTVCKVPDNVIIRNLSGIYSSNFVSKQEGILMSFSYAKNGTFPRLGFLSIKLDNQKIQSCNFHFLEKDFSGGVYSPVVYASSKNKTFPTIVYVSKFFDNSKLSVLNPDSFDFKTQQCNYFYQSSQNNLEKDFSKEQKLSKDDRVEYNVLSLFYKGFVLPIGISPILNDSFLTSSYAFIGATWVTQFFNLSIGFEPFTNCYGGSLVLLKNTESGNLGFKSVSSSIFNEFKFYQASEKIDFSVKIPMLKYSNLFATNKSTLFYGIPVENFAQLDNSFKYAYIDTTTMFGYSTIRNVGSTKSEVGGFQLGIFMNYSYLKNCTYDIFNQGINIGFNSYFAIPHILPFKTQNSFTFNFPTIIEMNIFPNIFQFANFSTSVTLLSKEIQKGIYFPLVPLYLNRVYLTASYSGEFFYKDNLNFSMINPNLKENLKYLKYQDFIDLKLALDLTINTGLLEKLGVVTLSCDFIYYLNQVKEKNRFGLKLSSQLVF